MKGKVEVVVNDWCRIGYGNAVVYRTFHKFLNGNELRHVRNVSGLKREGARAGVTCSSSVNNIKRCIELMLLMTDWKELFVERSGKSIRYLLTFSTLTLPCDLSPIEEKRACKVLWPTFLAHYARKWKVKRYVWRVERTKRGRLHWHVVGDQYISWQELRSEWNKWLIKNGLMKQFKEKYGHVNPNSTDIHSVTKVRKVAEYIAKYMSKKSKGTDKQKDAIPGAIWGASKGLKKSRLYVNEMTKSLEDCLSDVLLCAGSEAFSTDYVSIVKCRHHELIENMPIEVYGEFKGYMDKLALDTRL